MRYLVICFILLSVGLTAQTIIDVDQTEKCTVETKADLDAFVPSMNNSAHCHIMFVEETAFRGAWEWAGVEWKRIDTQRTEAEVDAFTDNNGYVTETFRRVRADDNSIAVADNDNDILDIDGGAGISTTAVGDVLTITNDAPDQIITINGATGTYPNFTIPPPSVSLWNTNANGIDYALGNVGVGTTTPLHELDVNGTARVKSLRIDHTAPTHVFYDSDEPLDNKNITLSMASGQLRFQARTDAGGGGGNYIEILRAGSQITGQGFYGSGSLRNFISTIGDSYFNTGNVGVGTALPLAGLHVASGVVPNLVPHGTSDNFLVSGTGNTGMSILNNGSGSTILNFGSNTDNVQATLGFNQAANLMTLGTNAVGADFSLSTGNDSEAVRILDNGNVGIGLTSPTTRLHVDGSGFFENDVGNSLTLRTRVNNGNGSVFYIDKYRGGSGTPSTVLAGDTGGNIIFRAFDGTNLNSMSRIIGRVDDPNTGSLEFYTIDDGALKVNMVMEPDQSITVGSNAMTFNQSNGNAVTGADIYMGDNSVIATQNSAYYQADSNNSGVGSHVWKNGANTTGGTNLMLLDNNGNLGIGLTTPAHTLDVAGGTRLGAGNAGLLLNTYTGELAGIPTAGADAGFQIQSPFLSKTVWDIRANDARDGIYFRVPTALSTTPTADKAALTIQATGRIGVGKGAIEPASVLHIEDDNPQIALINELGTVGQQGFRIANNSDVLAFQRASDTGAFEANLMSIQQSTGNVSIGSSISPSAKLDVQGQIKMQELDEPAPTKVVVTNSDGLLKTTDLANVQGSSSLWTEEVGGDITRSSDVNIAGRLLVPPSDGAIANSSIKIGQDRTGNGLSFLDLIGDPTFSNYGLRLIRNGTGANTSSEMLHRGTGDLRMRAVEAANVEFWTSNISRMTVDPIGNVGIGTTLPTTKLDVAGQASANISFTLGAHNDANRGLHILNGVNTAWDLITASNNNEDAFIVKGNGNVGIGTTNPNEALVVDGTIGLAYTAGTAHQGIRRNGVATEYFAQITGSVNNTIHQFTGSGDVKLFSLTQGGDAIVGDAASSHLVIDNNEIQAKVGASINSDLFLNPAGGDVIMSNTGSRIGVGTTNPVAPLHLRTSFPFIYLENTSTNLTVDQFVSSQSYAINHTGNAGEKILVGGVAQEKTGSPTQRVVDFQVSMRDAGGYSKRLNISGNTGAVTFNDSYSFPTNAPSVGDIFVAGANNEISWQAPAAASLGEVGKVSTFFAGTSTQNLNTTIWTEIAIGSTAVDQLNIAQTVSTFPVPVNGNYRISFEAIVQSLGARNSIQTAIFINGSQRSPASATYGRNANGHIRDDVRNSGTYELFAGDIVTIRTKRADGATNATATYIDGVGEAFSRLEIVRTR